MNPLRKRLETGTILAAPGAPDALSARLIAHLGFEAVYMTGLGATASRLGLPDLGLMTQTEMAAHARAMTAAAGIPVIADADTGYGGPLNIRRMIADYAMAGVAALHLEDQASPKRCGQLSGIRLVEPDEAEQRLRAAIAARDTLAPDMLIIGRTDALPARGIDEAVARARRYADCGVDLVFVDGIKTRAEIEAVAARVPGPKLVSLVDGTEAAAVTLDELQQMGFSICLYAVTTLFAGLAAQARALESLRAAGHVAAIPDQMSYAEFSQIVRLSEHQAFAHEFEP
ncbi:oxaloacetate decarboxylase [Paracoccus sp. (in: a-proteobacteria)]|jgi:2-methylisocitrate lyase-like PEP mutase family enzyme|uniref:isocitrate lyase/PEP mutase family protein n=1 Tax=Paracoccus sp. TaxID=267 RepID=UPI0035AD7DA0